MANAVKPVKKPFPYHSFLFVIHPILFLYAHNIYSTVLQGTYLPLAIAICMVSLLLCITSIIARNVVKGGIITSIVMIFFFNYELIINFFSETPLGAIHSALYALRLELGPLILGANKLFIGFGAVIIVLYLLMRITKRKIPRFIVYSGIFFIVFGITSFVCDRLLRELEPIHAFLNSVMCTAVIIVAIFVFKTKKTLYALTRFLNFTSVLLVGMVVFQITSYFITQQPSALNHDMSKHTEQAQTVSPLPDIYYIILDEYGGNDILKKYYTFSNQPLTDYFDKKGFYLADKSRSNYSFTALSLTSSLNMMYMDDVLKGVNKNANGPAPIINILRHNKVVQILKEHSYTYIGLSSNYEINDIEKRRHPVYAAKKDLLLSARIGKTNVPADSPCNI